LHKPQTQEAKFPRNIIIFIFVAAVDKTTRLALESMFHSVIFGPHPSHRSGITSGVQLYRSWQWSRWDDLGCQGCQNDSQPASWLTGSFQSPPLLVRFSLPSWVMN